MYIHAPHTFAKAVFARTLSATTRLDQNAIQIETRLWPNCKDVPQFFPGQETSGQWTSCRFYVTLETLEMQRCSARISFRYQCTL